MDEKNFNLPNPPADLPVSNSPDQDQRASQAPQQSDQPEVPQEPEDILASVDQAEVAVKSPDLPSPAPIDTTPTPPVPPAISPEAKPITKEPILNQGRRALVLGVIAVVLLAVIGGAGWYGYNTFVVSSSSSLPAAQPIDNQQQATPIQPSSPSQPSPPVVQDDPVAPTPEQLTDSDRDGLSDSDEELYGTNPNKVDSDDDGLTDRDEVKVFKTDPNNPDTDGDGFLDGEEVRGGYDPKGPGRLLEIEDAL